MGTPSFLHALKWSAAAEIASKAIQPLVFIILARLLVPEDYGVVAAAIMVISFTQVFWEAGMGKAIIQRRKEVKESATTAFWINIFAGVCLAALLFVFADFVALRLFQDVRVAAVLKVMTLQIFLGAAASIHTALLQKEMKFNRLFWVRLSTVIVPGFFSIPLAYLGFSYWALVAGTLVGQLAQVIILWRISDWHPAFTFNGRLARELWAFGAWVGLSGLLSWFFLWVDSLFVGAFLGTHELGLYRTGNQFVTMIYGFLFASLLPVLYSHFSSVQENREHLRKIFFKVVRIVILIAIPAAFLLYALGDQIGAGIFGAKWNGIEFVLKVMALVHGFAWVVGMNGEVYRAIGKPSYETVVNTVLLPVYLLGYYFSIQESFEIFIWTRFLLALVGVTLHLIFCRKAINLPVFSLLKLMILASVTGLVAPALNSFAVQLTANIYLQVALVGTASFLLMGGVLFLFERNGAVKDISDLLGKGKLK